MLQTEDGNFAKSSYWINYVLVTIIFILNFSASPLVKWAILGYVAFAYAIVLLEKFEHTFLIILSYCFLEGQARVVWEYHPFFRISFDLLVVLAICRGFLRTREFNIQSTLPKPMLFLIMLHFVWYGLQFFNPASVSYFLPLAATKIYLYPFLFFVFLRHNPKAFSEKRLKDVTTLTMFFYLMEVVLSYIQSIYRGSFMLKISAYYSRPMKEFVFTDIFFRPFGTTHAAGGVAVFFFICAGMLFLRNKASRKVQFLTLISIIGATGALLLTQIRSAQVKFIILVFASASAIIYHSDRPFRMMFKSLVGGFLILGPLIWYLWGHQSTINAIVNFEMGMKRWEKVDSYETFKARRAGPLQAYEIAKGRLQDFPFGLGPGMTAAGLILSGDPNKLNPLYDKNTFWGYDNLFLTLIVEFGYGAIFYISFILSIPILLFSRLRTIPHKKQPFASRVVLIAAIHVTIIIMGNWGAIGITYNPESFFFWLWAAIGLNVVDNTKAIENECSSSIKPLIG